MAFRRGTRGDDHLTGSSGRDLLSGRDGDDTLKGGRGNDLLLGGRGDDVLKGGKGDDFLHGGQGDDVLKGGRGDDFLLGGLGDDILKGGRGDDILIGGEGNDRLQGGAGDDILIGDGFGWGFGCYRQYHHYHRARGSGSGSHRGSGSGSGSGEGPTFDDYLNGGTGSDRVYAGWGDDTGVWNLSRNIGETDIYDGGFGWDTLVLKFTSAELADAAVQAELAALDAFLADNANPWTDWGQTFKFDALGATLYLRDWEDYRIKIIGGPANSAPVAGNDSATIDEDSVLTVIDPLQGLLNNDSDPDAGDTLTVTAFDAASTLGAIVTVNPDGTYSYDATGLFDALSLGETVVDSFSYTVSDGKGATDTAAVTVTVTGANDDPSVNDVALVATEGGAVVTAAFAGNDIDSDDDPSSLVYTVTSNPGEGAVVDNGDGTFSFDPGSDFQDLALGESRDVSFSYEAVDSHGAVSNSGTVTITVIGANDDPMITAGGDVSGDVEEDVTLSVTGDLDSTDADNGATAAWSVNGSGAGSYGDLSVDANGTWTYNLRNGDANVQALDDGDVRTDVFTIVVTDDHGATDNETITITVRGTNDGPIASDDSFAAGEDTPAFYPVPGVLANDTDVDGDTLTVTGVGPVSIVGGGVISSSAIAMNPDGSFLFDPGFALELQSLAAGGTADVTFDYTVSDGALSDTGTVTITVDGENDSPVASGGIFFNLFENGPDAVIGGVGDDIDSDDNIDTLTYSILSQPALGTVTPLGGRFFEFSGLDQFDHLADGEVQTVSFDYQVTDGHGATSNIATIEVNVTGLNDAPDISFAPGNDAGVVVEDDPADAVSGQLTGTDVDNGASLSWSVAGGGAGAYGSLLVDASGQWTYTLDNTTPALDGLNTGDTAVETFDVVVTDQHGATDAQTVTVTINGNTDNDGPIAVDDVVVTDEETAIVIDVLANDSDPNGDPLTANASVNPLNGNLVHNPVDDTYTYTPDPDFNGTDSFEYTISDGQGGFDTATVTITVNPVNDAPGLAGDLSIAVDEGGTVLLTDVDLSAVDPDDADTVVMFTLTGAPAGGTLINNGVSLGENDTFSLADIVSGNVTYDHDGGEGNDSFAVSVSDDDGASDGPVTVSVVVNNINDVPDAVDDAIVTDEETAVVIDVLGNDSDPDGDPIVPFSSTNPANGTLVHNVLDNTYTYTPDQDFTGVDSFTYTIGDGQGGTDTATVNVTVNPVNDAPSITGDLNIVVSEDGAVGLTTTDLSALDPDDADTAVLFRLTGVPADGTLFNNGTALGVNDTFSLADIVSNLVTYDHGGAEGDDSFTVSVFDDDAATGAPATVTVTVLNINDDPIAVDDAVATDEETAIVIDVLANDSDPDGNPLTVNASVNPANGLLVHNVADDTYTYTPDQDFTGTDSFEYTVSDGQGGFGTATVTITVNPVNDAPAPSGDLSISVGEDGIVVLTDADLSAFDPDDADSAVIFTLTDIVAYGTLFRGAAALSLGDTFSLADIASGAVSYDHDGTENFSDAFTVSVSDDEPAGGGTATVGISISPVNEGPIVAGDLSLSVDEDGIVVLNNDDLSAIDPDDADSAVSFTLMSATSVGVLTVSGSPLGVGDSFTLASIVSGDIAYDHDGSENFADAFTVVVSDDDGLTTAPATVNIIVTPVNDMPVFDGDLSITVGEGGLVAVTDVDLAALDDDDTDTTIIFTLVGIPAGGTLLNGGVALGATDTFTLADIIAGNISYDHDGSEGDDSFVVSISDDDGASGGTTTVNVTVINTNDAPEAVDDVVVTDEETAVVIDALTNDSDPDGDALTVTASTNPANGILVLNPLGDTFTYTPNPDFSGTDSFTYTISDGQGAFDTATVNITVNPVNDAPVFGGDLLISVTEGGLVTLSEIDLTALDTDDADTAIVFTVATLPAGGVLLNDGVALGLNDTFSLTDIIDGKVSYDHDGSEGDDSFVVTVSDDDGASGGTATVNVSVTNINDAPEAVDDAIVTNEETAVVIDVLANDTDLDGDNLTPIASTNPANGLLTFDSNTNLYTYTPNLDFSGTDSFNYTISDGQGGLDTGTVTITVNPINDTPVFGGDLTVEVNQAGQVALNVADLTAFDPDDANTDVTFILNASPSDGALLKGGVALSNGGSFTLADIVNGNVVYDHGGTGGSSDSFVVEVFDDEPSSGGTASVNVNVATVPAPPVAVTDNYVISNTVNVLMDLTANDTDDNDDPLSPIASTNPAHGFLGFIVADETYFYIPTAGFTGTDSFTYTITDGNGGFDVGAVNITTFADGDPLLGTGDDEVLQGSTLDDFMTGGGGDDLFQFDNGDGNDTIMDFEAGSGTGDRLDVREFGFSDLSDLLLSTNDVGPDTVIDLDADDSVTLIGVQKADLHDDDFIF